LVVTGGMAVGEVLGTEVEGGAAEEREEVRCFSGGGEREGMWGVATVVRADARSFEFWELCAVVFE